MNGWKGEVDQKVSDDGDSHAIEKFHRKGRKFG